MIPAPKFTPEESQVLLAKAHLAGMAAGKAAIPTPMLVGTPKNMVASLMGGDDGGLDPTKPIDFVSEGVCGFAYVRIRPATSSFARFLAKRNIGWKSYVGGWEISVHEFGQSLTRKEAYARAFASVLNDAGVTAYVASRMD